MLLASSTTQGIVQFAWEGEKEGDLNLRVGQTAKLIRWLDPDWLEGEIDGERGAALAQALARFFFFYVAPCPSPPLPTPTPSCPSPPALALPIPLLTRLSPVQACSLRL